MKLKFSSLTRKSQKNSIYSPRFLDGREKEIENLYNSNLTIQKIAQKLNLSTTVVYEKLKAMKIKKRKPQFRINQLNKKQIIELEELGLSKVAIAKKLNCCTISVSKKIKKLNLPQPIKKQERNSALKEYDEELKQMYLSGVLIKNIGEYFGVVSSTIIYRLTKLEIYQSYKNKGAI